MKKIRNILTFILLFSVVLSLGVSPLTSTALKQANYDLPVVVEE